MNIPNSPRLSFRLLDTNDAELLFQLDQDAQVMKYITGGVTSSREKIDTVFIPRMKAYRNAEKGWGLWQVNLLENDEYLGWILIRPMHFFSEQPEFDNLEIGWRFFRSSWGKGYATEAAQQVLSTIATDKSYKHFSAIAHRDNQGSVNVMKKLGMHYVKTYHHKDAVIDCDVVYYQMANPS